MHHFDRRPLRFSCETLRRDDNNAELRALRADPHTLKAGDRGYVLATRPKRVAAPRTRFDELIAEESEYPTAEMGEAGDE